MPKDLLSIALRDLQNDLNKALVESFTEVFTIVLKKNTPSDDVFKKSSNNDKDISFETLENKK